MEQTEGAIPPPVKPRMKKGDKDCSSSKPSCRKPIPMPRVKRDTFGTYTRRRKPVPTPRRHLSFHTRVDCVDIHDQDNKRPGLEPTTKDPVVSELDSGDSERNVSLRSDDVNRGINDVATRWRRRPVKKTDIARFELPLQLPLQRASVAPSDGNYEVRETMYSRLHLLQQLPAHLKHTEEEICEIDHYTRLRPDTPDVAAVDMDSSHFRFHTPPMSSPVPSPVPSLMLSPAPSPPPLPAPLSQQSPSSLHLCNKQSQLNMPAATTLPAKLLHPFESEHFYPRENMSTLPRSRNKPEKPGSKKPGCSVNFPFSCNVTANFYTQISPDGDMVVLRHAYTGVTPGHNWAGPQGIIIDIFAEKNIPLGSKTTWYVHFTDEYCDVVADTENYEEVESWLHDPKAAPDDSNVHDDERNSSDLDSSDWDSSDWDSSDWDTCESAEERDQESLIEAEGSKPKNKLEYIVHEFVSTEKDYVEKLRLLVQFQSHVLEENQKCQMFSDGIFNEMFLNIQSIYDFHHDFMLHELQQRLAEWDTKQKLGDMLKRLVPFLKLTSEYVTNFDHARSVIGQWQERSTTFASIINSLEKEPECQRLSLFDHMLEPLQRVPRYEMLLEGYIKHLPEDSSDKKDAEEALHVVKEVTRYSNDEMCRRDNVQKAMKIRESFCGNDINDVITADSEIIKDGRIVEISAKNGKHQKRYLFLLNDVLLLSASRSSKYRLMGTLSLEGMQVKKKDSATVFQLKSKQKVVELLASSPEEKDAWIGAIRNAIAVHEKKRCSFAPTLSLRDEALGLQAPTMIKIHDVLECMRCDSTFGVTTLKHQCQACGHVVCLRCSRQKMPLLYDDNHKHRVCDHCYSMLLQGTSVKATDDSLFSGFLLTSRNKKTWRRRYFAIHNDFVLYSFYDNEDSFAMTSVPLAGYMVAMGSDTSMVTRDNVFKLVRVGQKEIYYYKAEDKGDLMRWTDSLRCAIQRKVLLCRDSWQDTMLEDSEC